MKSPFKFLFEPLPVVRILLGLCSILGAFYVYGSVNVAREPLDALKAIGTGTTLLVFVVALGLADLINLSRQAQDAGDEQTRRLRRSAMRSSACVTPCKRSPRAMRERRRDRSSGGS